MTYASSVIYTAKLIGRRISSVSRAPEGLVMWSRETRIGRQSGCSSLKAFLPVLMAGLHFLAGLNLNSDLCVSDNGVDFLVIVCVPIGDFLTATVIILAD